MASLKNMLKKHPSGSTTDLAITTSPGELTVETGEQPFTIPDEDGQSVNELVEEISPAYLRACLVWAQKAMGGQVNIFKEGDYPHKMALLMAHRLVPYRKWSAKLPDETPAEVKKTSRALKQLIKSLAEDGEIIVDNTNSGIKQSSTSSVAAAAAAGVG